jgi:hypothetical protein
LGEVGVESGMPGGRGNMWSRSLSEKVDDPMPVSVVEPRVKSELRNTAAPRELNRGDPNR